MSGIYNGYNPIFESLRKEVFEQENKTASPSALSRAIYDQFSSLVMSGRDESIKSPEGFKSVMTQILGSTSLEGIKTGILKKIDELIQLDKEQAETIRQSKTYISELLDQLSQAVGDKAELLKTVIDEMNSFVNGTVSGLQKVKDTIGQNESLVSKYVSEKQRTGDESSPAEGVEDKKWWVNLSKSCLDTAVSFYGEVSSALSSEKKLAGNADMQKFSEMSQKFLDQARGLTVSGRKGFLNTGKIETEGGKMKGEEYRVAATNLINEILRQRNLFRQVRYTLSNIPTPPAKEIPVICPDGFIYDEISKACIIKDAKGSSKDTGKKSGGESKKSGGTEGTDGTGGTSPNSCEFPVKIGAKKCKDVKSLQEKLMSMGSCIGDILKKHGGSDGKYGKITAKLSNIAYAYLSGSSSFNPAGDLTEAMYKTIMNGKVQIAAKESLDIRKVLENKIFEKEHQLGPVLSFDTFSEVVSVAGYKIDEQTSSPSLENCICKTYTDGIIDPVCKFSSAVPDGSGKTGGKEDNKTVPPDRSQWEGIKYVNTGSYPVAFDESLLSAWSKEVALTAVSFALPGSGYLLKAGSSGIRSLGIKTASRIGAQKFAQKIGAQAVGKEAAKNTAKTAARLAIQSSNNVIKYFTAKGKIPISKRVAGGLIGGTVGAGVADFIAGRNSYVITVVEGYIDRTNLLGIVGGMVDTLDGYVSDDDWATITTVLAIIKGAWTTDESDNPVSAWKELKTLYKDAEGEDLIADIESVTAKNGDVEGYPRIKSLSPLSQVQDLDWDLALSETKRLLAALEKNEENLKQNLRKLPKDYVQALIEGNFVEYNEDGEIEENTEGDDTEKKGSKSGSSKM